MRMRALVGVGLSAALSAACSSRSRALDDGLPKRVAEITRNQIESYFRTNTFTGVPLLDRSVNWELFSNWPDQFTYSGHTYRLQLADFSEYGLVKALKVRTEVRPGMHFLARYAAGTNSSSPLRVSSAWHTNGSVSERIVDVDGKQVYGHLFVPSGKLYLFLRDDAVSKSYISEYFGPAGVLVGTSSWLASKQKCEWEGVEIDCDTVQTRHIELYHSFGN